ncbi:CAAX amino terminal protease family protein [Dictyocaulus viviparus]|uniref:CAAX prenyl protease 2 n=1 Tax=Dictyocaulus viviparus TaxID=29172 RepID=A0A0D8YAH1_DICVI|nr:CAAX amino terminal protease family protein [Dictyocaulus viviparus]
MIGCGMSISLSVLFPFSYVGLLHIADHNGKNRNDPQSILRRSVAALLNNIIFVAITYVVLLQQRIPSPLRSMGFRINGTLAAIILPSILISVLYTGQWLMIYFHGQLRRTFSISEWRASFKQPMWIRDAIVGPVTEEIAFRCCSAALFSNCFSPATTIIVSPLLFALSHFHHVIDDRRQGYVLSQSIIKRAFQFAYTYIFGAFATYLFLSTRHAMAPIVSHVLCNSMGLPLFNEIANFSDRWQRVLLWIMYGLGMCGFVVLFDPMTKSELYSNW